MNSVPLCHEKQGWRLPLPFYSISFGCLARFQPVSPFQASSIEVKHNWVKKMRQLIQDTYFRSTALPTISISSHGGKGSSKTRFSRWEFVSWSVVPTHRAKRSRCTQREVLLNKTYHTDIKTIVNCTSNCRIRSPWVFHIPLKLTLLFCCSRTIDSEWWENSFCHSAWIVLVTLFTLHHGPLDKNYSNITALVD